MISRYTHTHTHTHTHVYVCIDIYGFPGGSYGKESICSAGDLGLIPGLGKPPGEGNGYPLQYSNILAWIPWTEEPGGLTVHGASKSQTRLSD